MRDFMEWLTEDLKRKLLENGRRKAECDKNNETCDLIPLIYLTFRGNNGWLLASLSPDDPDLAHGLCRMAGGAPELGHVRLSDLEKLRDPNGLGVSVEPLLQSADPLPLSRYMALAKNSHGIPLQFTDTVEGSNATIASQAIRGKDFTVMADPAALAEGRKHYEEHRRRAEAESAKLPARRIRTRPEGDARRFDRVMKPDYRFRLQKYRAEPSEFEVYVEANKEITIRRDGDPLEQTFLLGDQASYDSWNYLYQGEILTITAKTVLISKRHERRARMNLYEFCWRNFGFDQREAHKRNADVSYGL